MILKRLTEQGIFVLEEGNISSSKENRVCDFGTCGRLERIYFVNLLEISRPLEITTYFIIGTRIN